MAQPFELYKSCALQGGVAKNTTKKNNIDIDVTTILNWF